MGSSQSSSKEPEQSNMPDAEKNPPHDNGQPEDDDEPDEWDKRIFSTGCAALVAASKLSADSTAADENAKMTDCYFEKKDWRACAEEMTAFRECWKRQGNEERTSSKDA